MYEKLKYGKLAGRESQLSHPVFVFAFRLTVWARWYPYWWCSHGTATAVGKQPVEMAFIVYSAYKLFRIKFFQIFLHYITTSTKKFALIKQDLLQRWRITHVSLIGFKYI